MNNTVLISLVFFALIVAMMLFRSLGQYDLEKAKVDLKAGAVLIDVRSEAEYVGGNVPGAINIPVSRIVAGVEKRFPDKSQTLLCYCASGARSGSAVSQLKAAGYENAHNLGSFNRALKAAGN